MRVLDLIKSNHTEFHSPLREVNIEQLQQQLKTTRQQIIDSLKRIHLVYAPISSYRE